MEYFSLELNNKFENLKSLELSFMYNELGTQP